MRSFIVMAMFVASFAQAAWTDYKEVRDLELDAAGIDTLEINAGAGSMAVRGVAGHDAIVVKATIVLGDTDDDDAVSLIAKKMRLSLDSRGDQARLVSEFEQGMFGDGLSARIDLEVTVPTGLAIVIDDGSGSIEVRNVANLVIDDGSGSVDIEKASGDVAVTDGSGSISVRSVEGSVTIDDGSGSIKVNDVGQDLIIVDDGSGGLKYSDVRGTVEQDT